MYLTNLRAVNRIRPIHLKEVADEAEGQVVLKAWLLDDSLPVRDELASPAQRFFRTDAGRRWLDAATGDLLTIFMLDAYLGSPDANADAGGRDEPAENAIDVLVAEGNAETAFVQATHEIARIFDVRLDALPVVIVYTSAASSTYATLSFADAKTEADVKSRCATLVQELRSAAADVFGPTRTAALAARQPVAPVTAEEGDLILTRLARATGSPGASSWTTAFAVVAGANAVYELLDHVIDILRRLGGG